MPSSQCALWKEINVICAIISGVNYDHLVKVASIRIFHNKVVGS
jgi:hypothetical protein